MRASAEEMRWPVAAGRATVRSHDRHDPHGVAAAEQARNGHQPRPPGSWIVATNSVKRTKSGAEAVSFSRIGRPRGWPRRWSRTRYPPAVPDVRGQRTNLCPQSRNKLSVPRLPIRGVPCAWCPHVSRSPRIQTLRLAARCRMDWRRP
jgi:hypothetical protein